MSGAGTPSSGEPVDWTESGPVSPRFGDVYFSAADGLQETRAVFLAGCDLPRAWASRRRFTLVELGFGCGLNILAVLQLWAQTRPSAQARLSLVSVEAFPLSSADAARALERWPELADLAAPLLHRWPRGRRGRHRYEWPDLGAALDLIVDDVAAALPAWEGRADAWFLDGFAPSKNPQMWTEPVLEAVAARSAPGARIATFTVAGAVRRGLAAQGLTVDKRPGFGRKKQRLEAVAPGAAPADRAAPSVTVIGAGVAGAALARALRRQGCPVVLVEGRGVGAGASGNAAALATPRLDAGDGPAARLHAAAFSRATALYVDETPNALIARGAVQLQRDARDAGRFARIAASDRFEPGSITPLSPAETAARLREPDPPTGLWLEDALVLEPRAVLDAWIADTPVARGDVARLEANGALWRVVDATGRLLSETEAVVVAAGPRIGGLVPSLAVRPVRGQVTAVRTPFEGAPAAWGGYAIPTRDGGVLFGASHGPGDAGEDVRPAETAGNLDRLAQGRPALAACVAADPKDLRCDRASVRATLRDHMPLVGAVAGAEGLYVLGALGGRGFTLAPLLAEHVAALAAGAPSPLPPDLQAAVSPGRRAAQEPPTGAAVPPAPDPAGPPPPGASRWPEPL